MSDENDKKHNPHTVEIDFGALGLDSSGKPTDEATVKKPRDAGSASVSREGTFELPELELSTMGVQPLHKRPEASVVPQMPQAANVNRKLDGTGEDTSGFSDLVKETMRPIEEVKASFMDQPIGGQSNTGDTAFVEDPSRAPPAFPVGGPGSGMAIPPPLSASMPGIPLNGPNLNMGDTNSSMPSGGTHGNSSTVHSIPTVNLTQMPSIGLSVPPLAAQQPSPKKSEKTNVQGKGTFAAPPPQTVTEHPGSSFGAGMSQVAESASAQNFAAPEATGIAAVPQDPKRKEMRRKLFLAGVASLGVLLLGYMAFDEFFGGSISSDVPPAPSAPGPAPGVRPPQGTVGKPGAPGAVPPKNAASGPQSGPAGRGKSGPAPKEMVVRTVPTPGAYFTKSKNREYFEVVERTIEAGEPTSAIKAFRMPLRAALTKEDKVVAAELETRYYLMVGNPTKGVEVLSRYCGSIDAANVFACVHYLRGLVSLRRTGEVRSLLEVAGDEEGLDSYRGLLGLIELGARALGSPNADSVRALFANVITELNVSPEWHRQRVIWFTRAFMALSSADRESFLKSHIMSKREMVTNSLQHLEKAGVAIGETLLASFLNYWAIQYELKPLPDVAARARFESDMSRTAALLNVLTRAPYEASESIGTSLAMFVGRAPFEELSNLVNANIALNDNNLQRAWLIFTREIPRIQAKRDQFEYEWAVVYSRCATLGQGTENLRNALGELNSASQSGEAARSDFSHWFLMSKIEREMHNTKGGSFDKARQLALTAQEKGLVAAEEARRLRMSGRLRESAILLQQAVKDIPDHGILLQTAAEIMPLVGVNPQKYLEAYSRIPERLMIRNQEFSPLSNHTIRKLLEML